MAGLESGVIYSLRGIGGPEEAAEEAAEAGDSEALEGSAGEGGDDGDDDGGGSPAPNLAEPEATAGDDGAADPVVTDAAGGDVETGPGDDADEE